MVAVGVNVVELLFVKEREAEMAADADSSLTDRESVAVQDVLGVAVMDAAVAESVPETVPEIVLVLLRLSLNEPEVCVQERDKVKDPEKVPVLVFVTV